MEAIDTFWITIIAAFAAGCAFGALLYSMFSGRSSDTAELEAALEEKSRELDAYKSGVTEHFGKTSELVNELTRDFVKVYQHLSEGGRTLGEPQHSMNLLEQQSGGVLINVPGSEGGSATAEGDETAKADPSDMKTSAAEESLPIDAASREYISETIREAADIAGEIEKTPRSAPGVADPAGEKGRK